MTENDTSFEIRDRRRFATTDVPAAEKPTESEQPEQADIQPDPEAQTATETIPSGSDEANTSDDKSDAGEAMPEISAEAILHFTIANLNALAWQNMGLTANPATGKVEPKFSDARLAIDAIEALIPIVVRKMNDRDRTELQTLLSNLKMNYVEQLKRQQK